MIARGRLLPLGAVVIRGRMASKALLKSFVILPLTIMGGAVIFTPAVADAYQGPWFVACLVMLGLAMFTAAKKRACGHGYIVQGKWGMTFPYVIRKCPVCGDIYE